MAKVKTATQRITDFLKAKGLDAAEIKDAFVELDAADTDLDKLAGEITEYKGKNEQWLQWYQQVAPEVQNAMSERDKLKERIAKMEAAGFKFNEEAAAPPLNPGTGQPTAGQYVTPDELKKFKQELAGASSSVMKSLLNLGFSHYDRYGAKPDLDAVEKLMADASQKGISLTVEDAYRQWSKPLRDERRAKKTQREVEEGIKKGVQDALSKQGISVPRRKGGDEIEQELLVKATTAKTYKDMSAEEKRQYDNDVKAGFMADMNADITH